MTSDMIFALRRAPGQDRANPVPDIQRYKNSEYIARRPLHWMLDPDALRDGLSLLGVIGLARRQQDPAEESGQFIKPVQWQDFGDILVRANDNQTALISVYFA